MLMMTSNYETAGLSEELKRPSGWEQRNHLSTAVECATTFQERGTGPSRVVWLHHQHLMTSSLGNYNQTITTQLKGEGFTRNVGCSCKWVFSGWNVSFYYLLRFIPDEWENTQLIDLKFLWNRTQEYWMPIVTWWNMMSHLSLLVQNEL